MSAPKPIARDPNKAKEGSQKKILDEAARRRRAKKAVEALELDNYHDDPHADLVMSKKLPKFNDNLDFKTRRRRKSKSSEFYKQRCKKSFQQLVEEESYSNYDQPNYITAQVPPSKFPARRFCAVCGFPSNYTCIPCGARYCSSRCLGTHRDTRCLKWTA